MNRKLNIFLLAGVAMIVFFASAIPGARGAVSLISDPANDVFGFTQGDTSSCFEGSNNYPNIDIISVEYGYVDGIGYQVNTTISGTFASTGIDKEFRIYLDVNGTSGSAPAASFMNAPFIQMAVVSSTWEGRFFINITHQTPMSPQFSGSLKNAVMTLPLANSGWIDSIPGLLPVANWVVFGYSTQQSPSGQYQMDAVNWPAWKTNQLHCTPPSVPGFETGFLLVGAGIAMAAIIIKRKK
jgi:hypothetical protein